ncbi:uncharacterized protein isoform X2 [Choristoneura fumiferana]|uniref:uncharacterized protein isoform X2 n=1 Tax=Choristoneura fumiferana TaxID=7141 RepID=UPI003D154B39
MKYKQFTLLTRIDYPKVAIFQRDFRQYGAVVVMVLSFDGTNGQLSALDGRFSESIILRHLTDYLNPTLHAKPKIYITEANRTGPVVFMNRQFQHSLPLEEHHQDVLSFHLPCNYYGTIKRRPLLLLCDNINSMADTSDFVSILKKTVEDATKTIGLFEDVPIELSNTLSKEMRLAKS